MDRFRIGIGLWIKIVNSFRFRYSYTTMLPTITHILHRSSDNLHEAIYQNSAQVPIRIKPYYVFAFPCGHKKSYVRSSSTVPPTDNSRAIVTLRPLGRRNCKNLKYSYKYLLECISRGDKALSKGTLKWVSKSNSLRTARGRHRDSRSSSKCQMSTRKKGQCQRNIFANSSQNA